MVERIAHTFSNGVTVVNVTPHPLTFLSPEGEIVSIPCSVAPGEKTGYAVINAAPVTENVGPHLVRTVFKPSDEGNRIIAAIREEFPNAMIVGSLAAANAYPDVVGMVPAPGFERVPPAEKRMSCTIFNVGDCW